MVKQHRESGPRGNAIQRSKPIPGRNSREVDSPAKMRKIGQSAMLSSFDTQTDAEKLATLMAMRDMVDKRMDEPKPVVTTSGSRVYAKSEGTGTGPSRLQGSGLAIGGKIRAKGQLQRAGVPMTATGNRSVINSEKPNKSSKRMMLGGGGDLDDDEEDELLNELDDVVTGSQDIENAGHDRDTGAFRPLSDMGFGTADGEFLDPNEYGSNNGSLNSSKERPDHVLGAKTKENVCYHPQTIPTHFVLHMRTMIAQYLKLSH